MWVFGQLCRRLRPLETCATRGCQQWRPWPAVQSRRKLSAHVCQPARRWFEGCVCARMRNLWPRLPQAGELPPRALATRSHWTRLFFGLRRCCIQAGTRFKATRLSCGVSTNRHGGESAYDFPCCESFFCAALCSDLRYTALMLRSGLRREQLRANKHTCVHGSSRSARL